jgi:FixJ family two-component response regulator
MPISVETATCPSIPAKGFSVASEPTVFSVDQDASVRASIAALAASMDLNCEGYESCEDFLAAYHRRQRGCLVLAIQLPGMSGLELMEIMVRDAIRLPTIIVSKFADVRLTVRAMHAGALTVLEKPYQHTELWEAIRGALALDAETRQKQASLAQARCRLGSLTHDEQRVLECILAGKTNKAVAEDLRMGLRTVEARRHSLMVKFQAESLAEMVHRVTEARTLLSTNHRSFGCNGEHHDAANSGLQNEAGWSKAGAPAQN